jgi:hypothetical protein
MYAKSVPHTEQRIWACANTTKSLGHACFHSIAIPENKMLSSTEMAGSINASVGFSTAEDLKKDQANVRRVRGGLKNLRLGAFMSAEERRALETTIALLDRVGRATERAKDLKAREQKAEETRQATRRKRAGSVIEPRYQTQDVREMIVITLAASSLIPAYRQEFAFEDLRRIRERAVGGRLGSSYAWAMREVRDQYAHALRELISEIGYSAQSIDELLEKIPDELDRKIEDHKARYAAQIDEFIRWLVEQKIVDSNRTEKRTGQADGLKH